MNLIVSIALYNYLYYLVSIRDFEKEALIFC